MEFYDADRLRELLDWPDLIESIRRLLADGKVVSPDRHVHEVTASGDDVLLLMPAWVPGDLIGIKAVTYFGSNTGRGLPNVNAVYLAFDGETGRPVAVMDGEELGSRRTAAASALAAESLARADAARLLVVGTGQLAPFMAEAHRSVRAYEAIEIWGRNPDKAAAVVERLNAVGIAAQVSEDLDHSVASADVISCVTSATEPLIRGELLAPGCHLDLVGSFMEDMRESDDDCVRRARLFVDTHAGALLSGDLAQPINDGVIEPSSIAGDLAELAAARVGRTDSHEITLFKSAGFALEDLAAATVTLDS